MCLAARTKVSYIYYKCFCLFVCVQNVMILFFWFYHFQLKIYDREDVDGV